MGDRFYRSNVKVRFGKLFSKCCTITSKTKQYGVKYKVLDGIRWGVIHRTLIYVYLILQIYHPDVSKQSNAAEKFSHIRNAYDVLGNQKRRDEHDMQQRYFRLWWMFVRQHSFNSTIYCIIVIYFRYASGPNSHSYGGVDRDYSDFLRHQGQWKQRSSNIPYGRTPIYNYDEFYRMHYSDWIVNKEKLKQRQKQYADHLKNEQHRPVHTHLITVMLLMFVFVYIMGTPYYSNQQNDYQIVIRKKSIENSLKRNDNK